MTEIDYDELVAVARKAVRGLSQSALPNVRDDIVQDALDELLRKDLLEGHPNPQALVVQTVRWRAIDTQRRWERAKRTGGAFEDDADDEAQFPPRSWGRPSLSHRVVELDAVKEALESLDPVDRVILWRHDVEGWEFAAVAAEVELAEGTVRNRASAARQRLREELGD